jgi:hypothetical protein
MEAGEPNAFDLSGTWDGLYEYPQMQPPVPFVARLTETDSWLAGMTQETDVFGRTLDAALQGRRTGHSVTMLKIYDGGTEGYDTVHYEGIVNADGTEIAGRWTIPGNWSGPFLMIRSTRSAVPVARETTERV